MTEKPERARTSDLVTGRAELEQLPAGVAVLDRPQVVWVKEDDGIWRSRERVPTSATTSRLIRLQLGPFRISGQPGAGGVLAASGRTHVGHDDITNRSRVHHRV